jgi:hypothetical protein
MVLSPARSWNFRSLANLAGPIPGCRIFLHPSNQVEGCRNIDEKVESSSLASVSGATAKGAAKTRARIAMGNRKVYLLAELTILPNFLDEVKTIFREAIGPARFRSLAAKPYSRPRETTIHISSFPSRCFPFQKHIRFILSRTIRNACFLLLR